jgi:predicted DNA-binding transcriptional regulator AlpA
VLRAPEPVPVGKGLSRVEAARKCGVSLSTFDTHVRPFVPTVKVGRNPRFLESDLDAWLTRTEPNAPGGQRKATKRGRRRATETVLDPKALAILDRLKGGKARV